MTYTNDELMQKLLDFYNRTGKIPRICDFKSDKNLPSPEVYINHFGSWTKALKSIPSIKNEISIKKEHKNYKATHYNLHGILNPSSAIGTGVITEHVVYEVLNDCIKCNTMHNFNSEYDLISEKYGTINVKSAKLCKRKTGNGYRWKFRIKSCEKTPNYYICIGFNDNKSKILKVWIIDSNSGLIDKSGIGITNSENGLKRACEYEVNSLSYDDVYQNLDITILSEFRNLTVDDISNYHTNPMNNNINITFVNKIINLTKSKTIVNKYDENNITYINPIIPTIIEYFEDSVIEYID